MGPGCKEHLAAQPLHFPQGRLHLTPLGNGLAQPLSPHTPFFPAFRARLAALGRRTAPASAKPP